jgi:hypothetical protein
MTSAKEAHMARKKQIEAEPPSPEKTDETERKPWKKKSPIEVVLQQISRLRDDVARREDELKTARRQLQKLEEFRKTLDEV